MGSVVETVVVARRKRRRHAVARLACAAVVGRPAPVVDRTPFTSAAGFLSSPLIYRFL